jgi:two-component system sensor histidine kinase PilS (NtrC family)
MNAPVSRSPWADSGSRSLPGDSAFARLWRGFATARVAIALVLLALLATVFTLGPPQAMNHWQFTLCGSYLAAALAVRLFLPPSPPGRPFDPQWVSTIGIDLVAYSTLQFLQAGGINYSPLYAVPVLMASVLGSALLAFGTAAAVTLLLLTDAWLGALAHPLDWAQRFLQAGLTGSGYFAVAFLANQLALRLAGEEETARRSQQAARMQAQVNERVIESLSDGVLVVDPQGGVHSLNPAGLRLLGGGQGTDGPALLLAQPAWAPLAAMSRDTFARRADQAGEIAIAAPGGQPRRLFVRTRLTSPQDSEAESLCVIFMEDLREMEARLRTEKLAAMGRMSAAVAHEIRNPLAAITQANALLEEDLQDSTQRQLSALIGQNAQRLAQIVDEILDVSRVQRLGPSSSPAQLALDAAVGAACADWALQVRCGDRLRLLPAAGDARVPFEPDHLRRVLVNLLDNALRYASADAGSIQVATSGGAQPRLSVWSDGAPLEHGVEHHLFEPFFSSESRSSGLGLYICRELCERHGAQIGYRRGLAPSGIAREGNEFFLAFRPSSAPYAGPAAYATITA